MAAIRACYKHEWSNSHFVYNLGETSTCASHCISCAAACTKSPLSFGRGCGQVHIDTCQYCQLVPDIVRTLEHFLNSIEGKDVLPLLQIQMLRYDIHDAHQRVNNFMAHTIRCCVLMILTNSTERSAQALHTLQSQVLARLVLKYT